MLPTDGQPGSMLSTLSPGQACTKEKGGAYADDFAIRYLGYASR